jgi:hypothetical protein
MRIIPCSRLYNDNKIIKLFNKRREERGFRGRVF